MRFSNRCNNHQFALLAAVPLKEGINPPSSGPASACILMPDALVSRSVSSALARNYLFVLDKSDHTVDKTKEGSFFRTR